MLGKGVLSTAAGSIMISIFFRRLIRRSAAPRLPLRNPRRGTRGDKESYTSSLRERTAVEIPYWKSSFFLLLSGIFLVLLPYSDLLKAVGLVPGVVLLAVLAFLAQHVRGESSIPGLVGITIWLLVFWLWAEAGRQGFVVIPVDVPSGSGSKEETALVSEGSPSRKRESSLEFTSDGIANALETEISSFGSGERGNYAQTEAAQILAGSDLIARLFPTHPWYKAAAIRSPQLTGLETSHVISNTQIHNLPLSGLYHVLRHIRGKPMIEGQILVGSDSLTLALRRSNYEVPCASTDIVQALRQKLERDGSKATMSAIQDFLIADQRQAKLPSGRNCREWSLASILAWLDVAPSPRNGEEERIANVSVSNLRGDPQLTELLHFAALEGMGSLSTERLAYYFDNAAKYESALSEYEESLPALLMEYQSTPEWQKRAIADRAVEALIRIGDLESELNDNEEISRGAYALAKDLSKSNGSYTRVLTRIGYHYLILGEISMLACKSFGGNTISQSLAVERCAKAPEHFWHDAESDLSLASSQRNASFYDYSGVDHGRDTLAWLNANYAYLLAHEGKAEQAAELLRRALYFGSPESRNWNVQFASDDMLFSRNEDLRAAAAVAYAWSMNSQIGPLSKVHPCPSSPVSEDRQNATCHLENLLKGTDQYTINNSILIESQLKEFYARLLSEKRQHPNGEEAAVMASLASQKDLHETSLFFLAALRAYRAGRFAEAAAFIQTPRPPDSSPLKRLQELATVFIMSTWQVHAPILQSQARIKAAQDALRSILQQNQRDNRGKNVDEVFWRAQSLRGVRKVMCLDTLKRQPCVPPNIAIIQREVEAAVKQMPDNAYLHVNLGMALLRGSNLENSDKRSLMRALGEFKQAVQINPWDPWLRCTLAEAYQANSNFDESQIQLHFAHLLDPSRWNEHLTEVHAVWPKLVYRRPEDPQQQTIADFVRRPVPRRNKLVSWIR